MRAGIKESILGRCRQSTSPGSFFTATSQACCFMLPFVSKHKEKSEAINLAYQYHSVWFLSQAFSFFFSYTELHFSQSVLSVWLWMSCGSGGQNKINAIYLQNCVLLRFSECASLYRSQMWQKGRFLNKLSCQPVSAPGMIAATSSHCMAGAIGGPDG